MVHRERERELYQINEKENGFRERARENFNRKNEKEKWVGFRERERERALSDKNEKENGFRERERERERALSGK